MIGIQPLLAMTATRQDTSFVFKQCQGQQGSQSARLMGTFFAAINGI